MADHKRIYWPPVTAAVLSVNTELAQSLEKGNVGELGQSWLVELRLNDQASLLDEPKKKYTLSERRRCSRMARDAPDGPRPARVPSPAAATAAATARATRAH